MPACDLLPTYYLLRTTTYLLLTTYYLLLTTYYLLLTTYYLLLTTAHPKLDPMPGDVEVARAAHRRELHARRTQPGATDVRCDAQGARAGALRRPAEGTH